MGRWGDKETRGAGGAEGVKKLILSKI